MVIIIYGDNMKKKWIFIIGIILIIVVLSFNKKNTKTNNSADDIVIDEPQVIEVVDNTSNIFVKLGHKLSNLITFVVDYIFYIINKVLEFVFGI